MKVLSSRPGASREKRRARWGRGVASSGSAVLAGAQGWRGPPAPVESVTAGFCGTLPLFWFASASGGPAQKQQGSAHRAAAQRVLSEPPSEVESSAPPAHHSASKRLPPASKQPNAPQIGRQVPLRKAPKPLVAIDKPTVCCARIQQASTLTVAGKIRGRPPPPQQYPQCTG